ncbi:MAG: hypothetical protein ACOC3T_03430 [Bacteroidota bacterium]
MIEKPVMRIFTLIILTILILTSSCKQLSQREGYQEGLVEYDVKYLENNMSKNIPTNLLPGKMILKFKNDKSVILIEGFMGLFSLQLINDHKKQVTTSLLKVIDKKYKYIGDPGEGSFAFREIPGMKVELRKGLKEIAGLKCSRGRVIFPGSDHEPFIFYYTDEIGIRSPNFNNPYSNVEGVLMKFQVKLHKLRMELEAENAEKCQISNKDFETPPGFKQVSRKDMEEILSTLME